MPRTADWLTLATLILSALVAVLMLVVPAYIWALTLTGVGGSPAIGLLTLNTMSAVRLDTDDPSVLTTQLARALIPAPGLAGRPSAVLLAPKSSWEAFAAAAPLVRLTGGPILVAEGNSGFAEIARLRPSGVPALGGARVIAIGTAPPAGIRAASVTGPAAADLAAGVDRLRARLPGGSGLNVLLVPDDPRFALPAAYWAAYSGDTLLFLDRSGELPQATRTALLARGGKANIYVIGSNLPAGLAQYGTATRLGGDDPAATAVALAQFRDEAHDFGWGLDGTRWAADHAFVLANPAQPGLAAAGIPLGRLGAYGPLLWTGPERLSPATGQYLWKVKPQYFMTPAEGPYTHLWVLGGPNQIAYQTQGEADLTQQIEAYRFEGAGLSGFEMLWILWIIWGVAAAVWLVAYSVIRLPQIGPVLTMGWALFGLALGPIALLLYKSLYDGKSWVRHGPMVRFERVGFGRTLAASVMNRSFDGPLMLVVSWLLLYWGLPLIVLDGPFFWLGNPMVLQIIITYVVVLLLHWLIMHAGMFARMGSLSYRDAVKRAFVPAFASMTAMTIGMMGFMWWIQMINLMLEHMARDDDIMWWGTTLFSILVGLLVALPVDHWLVQHHREPAGMS